MIVHWLTPDLGRIATVAKGARRTKSPFRGKLDLLFLAEFSFARSRRSDLHTLREIALREMHPLLRRDLGWLEQATYATELIEIATEVETPLPELFALLVSFLGHLPKHPPQPQPLIAFEMKLLERLGQAPDLVSGRLTEGARQILLRLNALDFDASAQLRPSPAQLDEIARFLDTFMADHLGRKPYTRRPGFPIV